MDVLRARISFQRHIRYCNILCLTETWLAPSVPDTAVTPSDNFSVLRMDRTDKASKTKGGGVYFMINKKWCNPRNISILLRSSSPHLHISPLSAAQSICPGSFHRSLLLLFTFHHRQTLADTDQSVMRLTIALPHTMPVFYRETWASTKHRAMLSDVQ